MEASILMAAAIAGAIVVLTPGPAVLALLGIGAAQGRRAGAGFLIGHLVGDTLWAMLALTALIGARVIAPVVFQVLAVVCGAYLFYLGCGRCWFAGMRAARFPYRCAARSIAG